MTNVLVTMRCNKTDEFTLEGFYIFSKEDWELIKKGIPEGPFPAWYGTNEYVEFEGKVEFLSYITEKEISPDEEVTLRTLLNLTRIGKFGIFPIRSDNY